MLSRRVYPLLILSALAMNGAALTQGNALESVVDGFAQVSDRDGVVRAYASGARVIFVGDVPLARAKARKIGAELAGREHWLALVVARATPGPSLRKLTPGGDTREIRQHIASDLRAKTSFGESELDSILLISLQPKKIELNLGRGYTENSVSENDARMIEPGRRALRDGLRIDDAIRDTIARIDRRRASARRLPWLIGGGAGLGFSGLLAVGAVARRRKRRRAIQRFEDWTQRFDRQQGALVELKRWGEILSKNPRYRGRTKELADSIVEDVQHVALIRGGALDALDEARKLIWPSGPAKWMNVVTGWRYEKALQVMSRAKVRFDADGDLARALRGESLRGGELEDIWQGAREVRRESRTFQELVQELNTRATRVDAVVQQIKNCSQNASSSLEVLRTRIERLDHAASEFETMTGSDESCSLPALRDALLPALENTHARMLEIAGADPVAAVENTDAAEAILQQSEESLEQIMRVLSDAIPQLRGARAQLESNEVPSPWVEQRIAALFRDCDRYFAALARKESSAEKPALFDAAAKTLEAAGRALEIARSRSEAGLPQCARLRAEVASERASLANQLGIDAAQLLLEDDANPEDYIRRAERNFDETLASLAEGNLDEAFTLVSNAHAELDSASRILADTRAALARYNERRTATKSRITELLATTLPAHRDLLTELEQYSERALSRDAEIQGPSRSIRDNVDEATTQTRAAEERVTSAESHYRSGHILESDHELELANSMLDLAAAQLRELRDRRALLQEIESTNRERKHRLEILESELERSRFESFVTHATGDKLLEAGAALRAATKDPQGTRKDPFDRARRLDEAQALLHAARSGIDADRAARAEARRSHELARDMHRRLDERCREARSDDIPDSDTVRDILKLSPRRERELEALASRLDEAHQDWIEIDAEIDAIHAQCFELKNQLERELDAGQRALRDVRRAGTAVREAASFADSKFGIRLPGSPGRSAHVQAKRRLERGDYPGATRSAQSATREAQDAIADAERRLAHRSSIGDRFGRAVRNATRGGFRIDFDLDDLVEDIFEQATTKWSGTRRYRSQRAELPRAPSRARTQRSHDSSTFSDRPTARESSPSPSRNDEDDTSGFGVSFDW